MNPNNQLSGEQVTPTLNPDGIGRHGSTSFDELATLREMVVIRAVEDRILELSRARHVSGSVHLSFGQESVPVGVLATLDNRDRILATYRGHGWELACGVPLETLLAEVLGRSTGTNGGRGGSAFATAPEYRFIGQNSIVAAGLPIANGVAMGLAYQAEGGVSVVSFGDGATNQGAAHEAIVFAIARDLPVIFVCENNAWSEMTPISATVPKTRLFQRASGYGLPSRLVDGSDVEAVRDAAQTAVNAARNGEGPTFLEITVPRLKGHYNGDIEHYRSNEDREAHAERDPISLLEKKLLSQNLVSAGELEQLHAEVADEVANAEAKAFAAPLPDPVDAAKHVVSVKKWAPVPPLPTEGTELAYGLAVNRALADELETRPNVVLFGEDIAIPGGTFGVTRNLRKRFGERVFDTPITESAILGAAIGASLQGLLPVVEIMWMDFLLVGIDQLINQAANVRYLSRGKVSAPIVIRTQQGITPGSVAQHSQSLEAILAHIPGIKVGLPSTSHDAYTMLRAAIDDPDPVVIIESRALYQARDFVNFDARETVGGARLRRKGEDLLIVTWGRMTTTVLEAAAALAERGISSAVLDLRWLAPLDEAAIAETLAQCSGKLLIVHEANLTGGFGAEISARIAERHLDLLDGPIMRIGLPDVRVPAAPTLQSALMPSVDNIVSTAIRLVDS